MSLNPLEAKRIKTSRRVAQETQRLTRLLEERAKVNKKIANAQARIARAEAALRGLK